eukprot:6174334-Pleurochrysis_carterae.AAC.4
MARVQAKYSAKSGQAKKKSRAKTSEPARTRQPKPPPNRLRVGRVNKTRTASLRSAGTLRQCPPPPTKENELDKK